MYFSGISPALPFIHSGQLRAIAVSSAKRSFAMPEVPSVSESGVRDFDINTWTGVFAPAGTPPKILEMLNKEIARILQLPEVAQRLAREGAQFAPNSTSEFGEFVKAEVAKYSQVIKQSGIKAE
jgi:tripartite-type tricarboxylate transporter receptor subunit TctC